MMDLRSLRSFVVIADLGGFARAADALNITQPTISAQILALEQDLGEPLFDRAHRPVRLTPAGEALLEHARALLDEARAAREAVAGVTAAQRGRVRLGCYPSATAGFVPRLLAQFGALHPLIRVEVVELPGNDLGDAALEGAVDLFLRQSVRPLPPAQFASLPLWEEAFSAIVPPGHALARRETLTAADLTQVPLILTDRDRAEGLPDHPFWLSLPAPPRVAYRLTQPQSVIEMVRGGHGIGVLAELALRTSALGDLRPIRIDHPEARREVRLWWPRHHRLDGAAMTLKALLATGAGLLPAGLRDLRPA